METVFWEGTSEGFVVGWGGEYRATTLPKKEDPSLQQWVCDPASGEVELRSLI